MALDPTIPRRISIGARIGYVLVVLLATLAGFHLDADPARVALRAQRAVRWSLRPVDLVDAARNIVLFSGFGAVWIITRRPGHPWRDMARVTLLGCMLSVFVEVTQLLSAVRISSINDVATNTIGAWLGATVIAAMTTSLRRARTLPMRIGIPLFAIAGAYIGAISADMFAPLLRHELNPGAGGSLVNRLMNALRFLRPFSVHRMSLTELALFWPAGALAVAALGEFGVPPVMACVATAVAGVGLSVAVELAHGVAGQPIELSAIAAHSLGIAVGAVIAWRWLPALEMRFRGRRRAMLLLAGYALLLVIWAWRPFVPRPAAEISRYLTMRHLTPLGMLGASDDLFGVMDVAEQFLLYMPLGFLLATWPLRRHGWLATVLPAVLFAVLLESGQLFVMNRAFDVTDLLTQIAAIGVGYLVARRAGYTPCDQAVEGLNPGWQ